MNKLYKLLLFLIVLMGFHEARASHMMGGDIAYECISPGKYKLVIKIYRDCRGIPFNSPDIALFCKDGSNRTSVNYTRTAINDLTPTCTGGTAPCNPQNTPSSEGIEEHVFEAIVDFNVSPFKALKDANCCEIMIKVEQCCRNSAITTISPGNFYTDAMINICTIGKKCNTSPQLSIPPVAYVCCNQPFTYNNGVREVIDGDSLAYELGTPLNANNSNESYTGNFNNNIPMTPYCPPNPGVVNCKALPNAKPPRGFYFDKETGDIVFTPTNCNEVGIIVIVITEWRKDSATKKWVKIGFTRRDMQIVVKTCPDNNPPYFTGNNKYSVCEGSKICFNIGTKDEPFLPNQTRLDTVALNWNNGIPGASFTIVDPTAREKTALFCWQTNIGHARPNPYTFTATAKDDNCPRPSSANRGYIITVKPKAQAKRIYEILDCGKLRFTAWPKDTFTMSVNQYKYQFTIRDSTNSGVPYYMGFNRRDSVKFKRGGKYIIEHQINNPPYNCPTLYVDTVIIPPVLDVELAFGKDTFVCAGNSITLTPIVSYGVPAYKYKWEIPVGTFDPKDTLSTYTFKPVANSKLLLTLTDKNKCVDSDTIFVRYQPNPIVDIGPDRRICTYESVTLDAQNADTMRYYWQPDGDSTRTKTVNIAGKYMVKVIDKYGCNTSDTMQLFVNDTVIAIAKPEREICIFDTLKVTGKRRPLGYSRTIAWRDIGTGITIANDSSFKIKISTMAKRNYEMYLGVVQGNVLCEDKDTFELTVNALPTFTYAGIPPHCFDDGAINLTMNKIATAYSGDKAQKTTDVRYFQQYKKPSWVTGGPVGVNTYVYDYPKFVTNAQVPKDGLRDTVCYDYKDYKGCYNKECKPLKLNPNPVDSLIEGTFCQKAGPIKLDQLVILPFIKTGGIQNFRVLEVPDGSGVDPNAILSPDYSVTPTGTLMDPGLEGQNERTGKYVIEYCFRDALSGCQTCDTTNVYVVKLPEISFDALPKQCINNPLLALDSFVKDRNTGQRFPNGTWEAIEYGGSRDKSDPNVGPKLQNAVIGKKLFNPAAGPGQYLLKLTDVSSGCPVADSTEILVNGLPIIQIEVPDTVCSSSAPFTLNNLNPSGSVGKWSGPGVVGRDFDPSISGKTKQYEGPYQVKFEFTNPLTGCTKADSQTLLIQSQPEVQIYNPNPYQQCEDKVFDLKAGKKWARNTRWTPVNGFGQFRTPNDTNSIYDQAFNDTALNSLNGNVKLRIATIKEGVCPVAVDEIDLILEPYPQFDFTADPVIQCEPATVNFNSSIRKPAGSPNLRYNWWFGNGDSIANSTTFNPQNILYDTAKRNWYDITLLVENRWGSNPDDVCSIRKDSIGYVKVLPQPKAGFSSDPGFFTTVAFPKFKFFNETKIRWTNNGKMTYEWYFGTGDLDDTSTQINPIHTYADDTAKYYVSLRSTYTYYDPITIQDYTCWDTISQLRKIGPDVTVFVPTAFSPEGTGPGTNNIFMAVVNGEKTFHIELFNRWGELLWQSDDKYQGWDGKYRGEDAQQDVYMWVIKVTAYDGEEYQYEGTVTLLR